MKKLFNIIFNRLYKYYGDYTGLLYSTTVLAGIVCLIGGGVYIILFRAINEVGEPLPFLEDSHSSAIFRLTWGPLIVIVIQQIFYQAYIYKNYYKKINAFFEENKPTNFLSKNAHYVSFIFSMVFFVASFFIGDFINNVIYN